MKTEMEIIAMRDKIQKEIERVGGIAREYGKEGDRDLFQLWDSEYAKLIAQYNILIEVLK